MASFDMLQNRSK